MQNFAFPPFFFQNGGQRSFQRRQPLVSFLSPFLCETTKKGQFCFHRARAARRSRGGLCEAQGEVAESLTKSFTAFSFDAHTALRARSLCCLCLFFALPQRIGEEKALRGLPLRTPRACAVAGEINLAARRKSRQLQLLRRCFKEKHRHGSCLDFAFVRGVSFCFFPCDRRKLMQERESKKFCLASPSWAHKRTPKMGSQRQDFLLSRFCFNFHLSQRKRQKLTSFAKATSVQLPCLQVF